jgi:hypothetical protein
MENLTRMGVFGLIVVLCCGCESGPRMLHPSQLWKMNRQEAWDEGTLSIPDPVDARLTQATATDVADAPIADVATP